MRLEKFFDEKTLNYLQEEIINHLLDSEVVKDECFLGVRGLCNDFSFLTAPAYKALEGFLFQIADDLKLPSANKNKKTVGHYYFDEEKVDKTIDKLLKELEVKTEKETKLKKEEKIFIKDMVKEMKRFLYHYRHTPAHFHGELIDTIDKARQNILSMYRIINETVKTLLHAKLVQISEEIH